MMKDIGVMGLNSSIVLVCAVLASLAAGVLLAHAICVVMFQIFRIHVRQVAVSNSTRTRMKPQTAPGGAIEG
jgi:hypothetical protein